MSTIPQIGTAGWSYPHWNGVVYPKSPTGSSHALEQLARSFSAVEINTSFYQPLKPELVKLWITRTAANPAFRFTAKLHQQFTHSRVLDDDFIAVFKQGLWPLLKAHKLGALLMQFPWAFRFTAENRDFFIRLRRTFSEFPLVAEMRHDSWMAEEAVGTLIDYGVGFCNIDQPEYTRAMPPTSLLTSGIGYVRLHGRNPTNSLGGFDKTAKRSNQHDYLYSEADLAQWAKRIERISQFASSTFVILNNDASAKSVVNALQLQAMVTGRYANAPRELRRKFPMELQCFGPNESRQQVLFPAA